MLYSVLTDRYAGLDDATLSTVERWGADGKPLDAEEEALAEVLTQAGFLVDARAADDAALQKHLDDASEGVPGAMYVILMPTLACNLACNYCFQKESPAFNRMTAEVESGTVRWILARATAGGCRRLTVHYFGGEPLTRKDYVLRTAEIFSAAMAAQGGTFDWELTTNAVHLDLPFASALRATGDGFIKITLDGDKETHDQSRVYRNGRGTFDRIFTNLTEVAGHVRLRIGGNFYPGQEASYERLMDRLQAADLLSKLEEVRFKPVVETSKSCTGCAATAESNETLIQITRLVQKKSAAAPDLVHSRLPSGPCELHWKNNFTIDPDGLVYKCPAVAGRPEMAVGSVCSSEADKLAPLVASRPWDQCGDCAFMPVCVGGCLGGQYLATGRTDQVFCKKSEFELMFREQVSLRYRAELGGREWGYPAG